MMDSYWRHSLPRRRMVYVCVCRCLTEVSDESYISCVGSRLRDRLGRKVAVGQADLVAMTLQARATSATSVAVADMTHCTPIVW